MQMLRSLTPWRAAARVVPRATIRQVAARVGSRRGLALGAASVSAAAAAACFSCAAQAQPDSVYDTVQKLSEQLDAIQAAVDAKSDAANSSAGVAVAALGPLDGRYRGRTQELQKYFSEMSLMQHRALVEVEYFIELCGILPQLQSFPKVRAQAASTHAWRARVRARAPNRTCTPG